MRRTLGIIFFLGILCGFLYLANLVVYEALAIILALHTLPQLFALGSVLALLSISFIVSTMVGMRFYNWFTRTYYTLAAVWMGFFIYLFFASVVYGLAFTILEQYAWAAGILCIVIALTAVVYGLIHAKNIMIKNVTVNLPTLPTKWRGRRAVWVSDLHLGQLHGPPFTRRVVEKINALSPDIVFIGGDLFDGTGAPDTQELIAPLREIAAPLGTYLVTGNHEEFGDSRKFIETVRSVGIRVLMDEMITIDGLQLIGVDYSHASKAEQFKNILQKLEIDPKKPSILLKHEPKDLAIAEQASISLQISGHTHHAQQWPLGYISNVLYKGFSYGLKNFKNMQVYVSSGVGTWGPPLRIGTNSEVVVFTIL